MAIAYISTTQNQKQTATSFTESVNATGADKLIVSIVSYIKKATSVTFNGTESFTLAQEHVQNGLITTQIWYLDNPTQTTANVVMSGYAANTSIAYGITLLSGTATGIGNTGEGGQNGGSYTSGGVTTNIGTANSWHITAIAMAINNTGGFASSDGTYRWGQGEDVNIGIAIGFITDNPATGNDTNTLSWTEATNQWAGSGVEILEEVATPANSAFLDFMGNPQPQI